MSRLLGRLENRVGDYMVLMDIVLAALDCGVRLVIESLVHLFVLPGVLDGV